MCWESGCLQSSLSPRQGVLTAVPPGSLPPGPLLPPITGLPSPPQSGDSGSQCHLSGSHSQFPEPEPWGVSMALTSWGHVQTLRGRQSAPHPRPRLSWCNLHILCRRLRPHTDVGMREAFLTPRLWGTAPQGFEPCACPQSPMSRWGLAEADGAEAAAGLS